MLEARQEALVRASSAVDARGQQAHYVVDHAIGPVARRGGHHAAWPVLLLLLEDGGRLQPSSEL